jgi:hypothetical protein
MVLGLHNGEHGQFLHLLASGVTPEYTWPYGTIANRMPVLWLRDRHGRWHTARPARSAPLRDTDDFLLWHRIVPPSQARQPQTLRTRRSRIHRGTSHSLRISSDESASRNDASSLYARGTPAVVRPP